MGLGEATGFREPTVCLSSLEAGEEGSGLGREGQPAALSRWGGASKQRSSLQVESLTGSPRCHLGHCLI